MGEKPIVLGGIFSKGTCQMINDTLTGREGVKMDAMRVFRQTKRPSLIGGGLSWLNIRLGARISCHKHYSTWKEGRNTHAKGSHRHTSNRHGMARRFTHSLFSYSISAGITSGHTDRGKTSGRISLTDGRRAILYPSFPLFKGLSPCMARLPLPPCRDVDAGHRGEGCTRARYQGTTP